MPKLGFRQHRVKIPDYSENQEDLKPFYKSVVPDLRITEAEPYIKTDVELTRRKHYPRVTYLAVLVAQEREKNARTEKNRIKVQAEAVIK